MDITTEKQLEELAKKLFKTPYYEKVIMWRKTIRQSIAQNKLMENLVMKEILWEMDEWIEECNIELLNNRDLSDVERKAIFERRDAWSFLKGIFEFSKATLQNTIKSIDEEHKNQSE